MCLFIRHWRCWCLNIILPNLSYQIVLATHDELILIDIANDTISLLSSTIPFSSSLVRKPLGGGVVLLLLHLWLFRTHSSIFPSFRDLSCSFYFLLSLSLSYYPFHAHKSNQIVLFSDRHYINMFDSPTFDRDYASRQDTNS